MSVLELNSQISSHLLQLLLGRTRTILGYSRFVSGKDQFSPNYSPVDRDTRPLTPDEYIKHAAEVEAVETESLRAGWRIKRVTRCLSVNIAAKPICDTCPPVG
jgi:hypothetical protein